MHILLNVSEYVVEQCGVCSFSFYPAPMRIPEPKKIQPTGRLPALGPAVVSLKQRRRPVAGHDQIEVTIVGVIMNSESTTGLRQRLL